MWMLYAQMAITISPFHTETRIRLYRNRKRVKKKWEGAGGKSNRHEQKKEKE